MSRLNANEGAKSTLLPKGELSNPMFSPAATLRHGVALLLLLLAIVSALIASASLIPAQRVTLASLAVAALLGACLLFVTFGSSALSLFNLRIGPWLLAYSAVAFGLASLTAMNATYGDARAPWALVPEALFPIAIGFVFLTTGYRLGLFAGPITAFVRSGRRLLRRWRRDNPRSVGSLYGLFVLGLGVQILEANLTGSLGYLGDSTVVTTESASWYAQPLSILSQLTTASIFGLGLHAFSDSGRRNRFVLLPAVSVAVLLGVLTGMKENFVDVALAVFLALVYAKGRVRPMAVIATLAVFVFLVTPAVTQLRGDVRSSPSEVMNTSEALATGLRQLSSSDGYLSDLDFQDSALQVVSRIRLVDNFIVIQSRTPASIPYQPLESIASASFTGLIPRAIWPDKPVRLAGYEFYRTYWGGIGQSSSAVTLQGSLYMHGGIGVLVLGMFIVGLLLRALDDGLAARRSAHAAILLVFLAPVIVKQEMDVPGFLASLPVYALTWFVAVLAVFERYSDPSRTPGGTGSVLARS